MIDASTQVRVRFVTSNDTYRISDAPFVVPARLGRVGLSEVINHLLGNDEKMQFDFQIGEYLLRVPLYKFVLGHRLSTEETITIAYFVAVSTELTGESEEQPAWIAAIDSSFGEDHSVTGCYDGSLRVVDSKTLAIVQVVPAHDEPVVAVRSWHDAAQGTIVGSASKDNTVKLWSFAGAETVPRSLAVLVGHINSVETVHHWAHSNAVLSGDWSGHLLAWKMSSLACADVSTSKENDDKKKTKRRKIGSDSAVDVDAAPAQQLKPFISIKAHTQSVSGIHTDAAKGYSSSWDHSIKVWDLERQDNVYTINTSKVVTAMDVRGEAVVAQIATSHPDGRVRVWDERRKESTGSATHSLGNDSVWISQVKWQPGSEHALGSVDYNGAVSLWDIRLHVKPVATTSAHSGKALCMDWWTSDSGISVLSGGSDCVIKATSVKL